MTEKGERWPGPAPSAAASAEDLAGSLLDLVEDQLLALAAGPLPGLDLPRVLIGHEAGPDVRADLLFTLGLLHDCGRSRLGGADGMPLTQAMTNLLAGIDGRRTNTFYSYRVAETVARFGAFDGNPLLASLDDRQRQQVALAADSTDWIELLDAGILPRNYAAVLARCEQARCELGLLDDTAILEDLLGRVAALLGGHLDDSNAGIGRYDIYTVDVHLFCEPLAGQLGDPWNRGARRTLDLVDRVAGRDGAAVAWGRSTGILAVCHTIELGGLVARRLAEGVDPLTDDPGRWLARAASAAAQLDGWFRDGWVTAHVGRSSDPYRGLDRRLQMTLDCLGKLVDAARGLGRLAGERIDLERHDLFPDRDELLAFDEASTAAVWAYRRPGIAFTLPLVGGTTTDYLPTPRNPGTYEVPVGSPLVTGSPMVLHHDKRYAGGGLPVSVEHRPGVLHAQYEGFPEAGFLEPDPPPSGSTEPDAPPTYRAGAAVLDGTRDVTWRVDGRTIHVEEHLRFDEAPGAVAIQVTEAEDRPLVVRFHSEHPHTATTVDVAGIAEYRSCWGELPKVHQVDLEPATSVELTWSVTPKLRVVSSGVGSAYNDCLYASLLDRVRVEHLPYETSMDPRALGALAARTDQFHLHWPEWLLLPDVHAHHVLIDGLRGSGVRIVWTQHNLIGHDKNPATRACYQAWAGGADLVIHHSVWGSERAQATYDFNPGARHVVIPHGHFGGTSDAALDGATRHEVEEELGLRHDVIRLGVLGAPRVEKDVEVVMRAVARSTRRDIELLVLSLGRGETVPDDPRIVAHPYEEVPRSLYDRRLAAIDAIVMPFDPDGEMLTSGLVADAIGFGIPAIASSWPFLAESLGAAAITYGSTEDELLDQIERLDRAALEAARAAAVALRPAHEWSVLAERTYTELDRLGTTRD